MDNLTPLTPITPENPTGSEISPSPVPVTKLPLLHLILLSLLLLLVALKGYWIFERFNSNSGSVIPDSRLIPTPITVINWVTYTNEKSQYSVNYPSDMYIDPTSKTDKGIRLRLVEKKEMEFPNKDGTSFIVEPVIGVNYRGVYLTPEKSIELGDEYRNQFYCNKPVTHTKSIINGNTFYLFEHLEKNSPCNLISTLIIKPSNKVYEISLTSYDITDDLRMKYNRIVASFATLPEPTSKSQFCGGIAGIACPTGYICKLDGSYPDASGTCIKQATKNSPTSQPKPIVDYSCKTGGCSSELCLDASSPDIASICVYKTEYNCLHFSVCEKQSNGKCGWTQTPEYVSCMRNPSL